MRRRIAEARSLLFVPGDRPDRFAKADASGADLVILDLEDAVAPAAKDVALGHVLAWLDGGGTALVRINAVGAATHAEEVAALSSRACGVVLPKADDVEAISCVSAALGDNPVLALVETARGVRDVDRIAEVPGVVRLLLGTVDLATELGIDAASHTALAHARGSLVVASAAAGLPAPVDGVTVRLDDAAVLDADLAVARDLGFGAKLCIHPRQVSAVTEAFRASVEEVAWAHRVLAATAAADGGVTVLDGAMVDAPVVLRAERILSRA